jgi:hypothetical protein
LEKYLYETNNTSSQNYKQKKEKTDSQTSALADNEPLVTINTNNSNIEVQKVESIDDLSNKHDHNNNKSNEQPSNNSLATRPKHQSINNKNNEILIRNIIIDAKSWFHLINTLIIDSREQLK